MHESLISAGVGTSEIRLPEGLVTAHDTREKGEMVIRVSKIKHALDIYLKFSTTICKECLDRILVSHLLLLVKFLNCVTRLFCAVLGASYPF